MTTATVEVCASCLRASCFKGKFLCDNAKAAGTVTKTRAELRELEREHPSWWKNQDPDADPQDAGDVRDLAIYHLTEGRGAHPDLFVSYLVGECGLDRVMVRDALRDVWPEAARLVVVEEAK